MKESSYQVNMEPNDLVSIIIPAFNAANYLENTLSSILNQTYKRIEIVIINDGSTDSTGEIAERMAKEKQGRIKYIHQMNSGVTTARMKGVLASSGDWIGFVDADDELEPDMVERLLNNALQYHADISHCGYQKITNSGERGLFFSNSGRLTVQDGQEALLDLLDGPYEPSLCTKLFRRDLLIDLIESKEVDPTIKYNEDFLMSFILFDMAHLTVYEDFRGYHYLANSGSATRGSFRIEKVIDPIRVREQILQRAKPALKNAAWRLYLGSCINGYYSIMDRAEYKRVAQDIKAVLKSNKSKIHLLSRNQKIKMCGVLICPRVFYIVFQFYTRHFKKACE